MIDRRIFVDSILGSDANDGSIDRPVRTLGKASDLAHNTPSELNIYGTFGKNGPDVLTLNAEATVVPWRGKTWGHVCVNSEFPAVSVTRVRAGDPKIRITGLRARNKFRENIKEQAALPKVEFAGVQIIGIGAGGRVYLTDVRVASHQVGFHVAGVGDELFDLHADKVWAVRSRGAEKSSGFYASLLKSGILSRCRFENNGGVESKNQYDVMNHGLYVNMEHREQQPWIVSACQFIGNRSHGAQFRPGVFIVRSTFEANSCHLLSCLDSTIEACKFSKPVRLRHCIDLNQGEHVVYESKIIGEYAERITQSRDPWYDPYWPTDQPTTITVDGVETKRIVPVKARVPVQEVALG